MPSPRLVGLVLTAALTAAACSGSSSPSTTSAGGFLLAERTEDAGVAEACIDFADDFLEATAEHVSILGQRTFAEWVTNGLWYIDDQSPDAAARLADALAGYAEAGCPQGYLAATIIAHGDRFDLKSAAAAIWWAGVVSSVIPQLGEGAADDAQAEAWLALAATSTRDLSERTVVPDQAGVDAIAGCDELGVAATNLLQQQLYLASSLSLGEPLGEVLDPLRTAMDEINQLRGFSDCDTVVREHLLRSSHDMDFAGASVVVSYATELNASWSFWSEDNLMPGLELGVRVVDQEAGDVEVTVSNVGNIPLRIISVELAGVAGADSRIDVLPGEEVAVAVALGEITVDEVDLVVQLQAPTGGTQTQSASVVVGADS